MHRSTKWRHKTGRSKKVIPKGPINYEALAVYTLKKFFPILWREYREDMLQEVALISFQAKNFKKISVKRRRLKTKIFGNGRDRMGQTQFSRACQCHFLQVFQNYGFKRHCNVKILNKSQIREIMFIPDDKQRYPIFEAPQEIIVQLKQDFGETLNMALDENKYAIEIIRKEIWS